jgi:DNA-binding transcriptional ArsR family regulator
MRYKSTMHGGPKIAGIAALVGDPARASILMALMAGSALTASELAYFANVTPQTASGHLAKLVDGGILAVAKQGRHRYFRLHSPLVGQMLEGIMAVAEGQPVRYHPHWRGGEELRYARVCYDHMAGELAVRIADALAAQRLVLLSDDGGEVTSDGEALLRTLGIDVASLAKQHRIFCRPCLDWSMRRSHIAGAVGAALLQKFMERGWLKRIKDSRALKVMPMGQRQMKDLFGVASA